MGLYPVNLVQHFRRPQVPLQPIQGGCAETAAHPAPHLGGNTHGIPMMILHPHTFYDIAVLQAEEELPGPVNPGYAFIRDGKACKAVIVLQLLPQFLGQA